MNPEFLVTVREYSALALMGTFTLACILILVWVAKAIIGRGLEAFNGIQGAVEALKDATIQNTDALDAHRRDSAANFERLSREIAELGRR